MPIDRNSNAIMGLHEDGSLSIFVEGDIKKEGLIAAIKQLEESQQSKDADSERNYDQLKKLVL